MKMQEIDDFLNRIGLQTSRKQSKLEPFIEEIFELKRRGCSQVLILQFLKECKNVEISQQALNYFIRSRSTQMQKNTPKLPKSPQKSLEVAQSTQAPPETENSQKQAENPLARRGLRKPTPTRKFNWDERPDPETLK